MAKAMKAMKKSAMKAVMKAVMKAKSMKKTAKKPAAMKKAMKVSKIARGKLSKSQVFKGRKEKTVGGLKKADIVKNKNGRYVSKKASAVSRKNFSKSFIGATMAARKALGLKGFVPIGGKTAQGQKLLAKARSLYKKK